VTPSRRTARLAVIATFAVVGSATAAAAAPTYPPATVDPNVVTTTTPGGNSPTRRSIPTEVLGEQVSRGADGSLPLTGGDVAGIVAIGGAALIGGGLLVRASRRRRDAETA
jgi:LPXTG-motif cell wall-anchored protein